jgi:hypothetical protein
MMDLSSQFIFRHYEWYLSSPPNVGKWSSLNIQSVYQTVNKSTVSDSRYLIIDGNDISRRSLIFYGGPMEVHFDGKIGAYIVHPNFHR